MESSAPQTGEPFAPHRLPTCPRWWAERAAAGEGPTARLFGAPTIPRSSSPPTEAARKAWEPRSRILEFARMARETRPLVARLDHKTARAVS